MSYDASAVRSATGEILSAIGEDPMREGLVETPDRVARSFAEIFSGLHEDPSEHLKKTFHVDTDELVILKDITFYSMCEHHLLPFFGRVHVAYLPANGRITGLSKLARCVDGYARRPQVQERLTGQIASAIESTLTPLGVGVIVEAEHMCMTMRGVHKEHPVTMTSTFRGTLAESARKQEVLSLVRS
ncbi:GTP cyclohydrolase I FolE [Actinomycetaceae bacterium MB13-C1-2]|nr:GTP cyclohydrolase I FolE [Actinomycetaceae bacterium MB13-C1-2]